MKGLWFNIKGKAFVFKVAAEAWVQSKWRKIRRVKK